MKIAESQARRLASSFWSDDAPVVQGREVVPGVPIPLFGDDVWDLHCLAFRSNTATNSIRVDFTAIDDQTRILTAKELVMQRLNRPLPTSRPSKRPKPIGASTAADTLRLLKRLWQFMDERGIARVADLQQEDLNAFHRELADTGAAPLYQAYILKLFYWLYESRELLTYDSLTFLPWRGQSLLKLAGYTQSQENLTERIPEEIMSPLLRWAMAYVDMFSHDIIAALSFQKTLTVLNEGTRRPRAAKGDILERLTNWLDDMRQQGRPLPGSDHRGRFALNIAAVAQELGTEPNSVRTYIELLSAAAEELGIAKRYSGPEISVPSGAKVPWRDPLDPLSLKAETRHLVEACYIVCAYLSGMRDSEVQELRRGCLAPQLDENGDILRHKVRSTTYKGKNGSGEKRTWVVIGPVFRAIETLERTTKHFAEETGSDLLMVNVHNRKQGLTIKTAINRRLREFQDYVNAELAPRLPELGIGPVPPGPNGRPWQITTRQFRRTVAWHIANRPFGTVAGMVQYGHTAEVIFEGYGGTSASGFRSEVEAERALARQADIVEMYEDHKRGIRPAGPMASEISVEFDHIQEEIGDFPGKIVDLARRDKMLRHLRVRLVPGLLADCFFAPEDARCLSHLKEPDRKEPIAGICDPHCNNACWTKKHLAVWEHALHDTERLGKRNHISSIQRTVLQRKAAEQRSVITAIREASHGH